MLFFVEAFNESIEADLLNHWVLHRTVLIDLRLHQQRAAYICPAFSTGRFFWNFQYVDDLKTCLIYLSYFQVILDLGVVELDRGDRCLLVYVRLFWMKPVLDHWAPERDEQNHFEAFI